MDKIISLNSLSILTDKLRSNKKSIAHCSGVVAGLFRRRVMGGSDTDRCG